MSNVVMWRVSYLSAGCFDIESAPDAVLGSGSDEIHEPHFERPPFLQGREEVKIKYYLGEVPQESRLMIFVLHKDARTQAAREHLCSWPMTQLHQMLFGPELFQSRPQSISHHPHNHAAQVPEEL